MELKRTTVKVEGRKVSDPPVVPFADGLGAGVVQSQLVNLSLFCVSEE